MNQSKDEKGMGNREDQGSAVMQQEKYPIKRIYTADLCVQKQCSVSSPNSLTVCLPPTKVITVFLSNSTVALYGC